MTYKSILSFLLFLASITFSYTVLSDSGKPDHEDALIFHAIYSKNLREIMHRLTQSVYDGELNSSQNEEVRMKHIQQLFDNASELYVAAENLTQAIPGFDLSKDEKNIFEGLAKQLQTEANNLGYMAENNDQAGIKNVFKRLNDTCAACHELFRF